MRHARRRNNAGQEGRKTTTIRNLLNAMYKNDSECCSINSGNEILVYQYSIGRESLIAEIAPDDEKWDSSKGIYKGYAVDTYWIIPAREILKANIAGLAVDGYTLKVYIK